MVEVAPLGFLILVVVVMAYMFWGLRGWLGVIIGLLMMMVMPPKDVRRG